MKAKVGSKDRTERAKRASGEFAPRRVLAPHDFSALAEGALRRAEDIARQYGSELMLVSAVEPIVEPVEFAIVPADLQDINSRQLEARRDRLETVRAEVAARGTRCRAEARLGKPWHVIVDAATRWKADLIVIATHGRKGPKHFLMGSTAERVVQHAPCAVLVVR